MREEKSRHLNKYNNYVGIDVYIQLNRIDTFRIRHIIPSLIKYLINAHFTSFLMEKVIFT